jgi:hypothetical protein
MPSNEMPDEETVVVRILKNGFEAQALTAWLESRGIAHLVDSFVDTAYDGVYVSTKGWGALRVFARDQAQAEAAIEAFFAARENDDGPEPEEKPA